MISPNEIDSIEEIGSLGDEPVKLIKVIGGFHIATAKVKGVDKALSMGSHAAIVKHNLEKTYGQTYRPHMAKSESGMEPVVSEKSSFLEKGLSDKGFTLHMVDESGRVSAILSQYGVEILRQNAMMKSESVEIAPQVVFADAKKAKTAVDQGVSKSLVYAFAELAKENGLDKISYLTTPLSIQVDKIVKK